MPFALTADEGLGRDDDGLPRDRLEHLADGRLGAVSGSRVDEVDPEVDRVEHQPRGFVLGFSDRDAETTEPAATETGDADLQPGLAQSRVLHRYCTPYFSKRSGAKPNPNPGLVGTLIMPSLGIGGSSNRRQVQGMYSTTVALVAA